MVIRQITIEDVPKLAELYNRVWPGYIDHHLKKAEWSVRNAEYPGVCAEEDDIIVGSRSVIHTNTYLGDNKLECVQLGDSCVDKRYRGQGLFLKMNKVFLENYFKSGGELIYNFSVEASKRVHLKNGWTYIRSMTNMIFVNHPVRFAISLLEGVNTLGGASVENEGLADISVLSEDLLNERERVLSSRGLIHTLYDRKTLEVRLGSQSGIKILCVPEVGACLYKNGEQQGLHWCTIGEIFLKEYSYKSFNKIIKSLKKEIPTDVITVNVTISHPLYNYYRRNLFLPHPRRKYLNHGVKIKDGMDEKIYYSPETWALSTLDIDTF